MVLAERVARPLKGKAKPRIAPPVPAVADIAGFRATAQGMGIELMPWQETAARYLTATGPDGLHLYAEVCIVVARQNGKTTLMKPLIVKALREGRRVMHIAQNRNLPRQMFDIIADAMSNEPDLLPRRRGKIIWPRYGAGQEEVILNNGGTYRIAASSRGSARGTSNDIVIIDELREMADDEVIRDANPTLGMSLDPQKIYLSNAGDESSVVLNAVRERAGKDSSLAYLEWSAPPELAVDDLAGWAQANPALGHFPSVMRTLEQAYTSYRLSGSLGIFETEHLCRWVPSVRERLVDETLWQRCGVSELPIPTRPFMGVSMDPAGKRASAALAWPIGIDEFGLQLLLEGTGNPIEPDLLGPELREMARQHHVLDVGFDPLTDQALAKFFTRSKPIAGQAYANASSRFALAVESGKLRWTDCAAVGEDLTWTARKEHDESGSFQAVRANDERPITAALAAIRAVAMAALRPRSVPGPRQPQAVGF